MLIRMFPNRHITSFLTPPLCNRAHTRQDFPNHSTTHLASPVQQSDRLGRVVYARSNFLSSQPNASVREQSLRGTRRILVVCEYITVDSLARQLCRA